MENNLKINNVISEVAQITKAPAPIIYGLALSVLSTVCQGGIDVQINSVFKIPTGLFIITLADSGERKSSIDNLLSKPLLDINHGLSIEREKAKAIHQAALDEWNLKHKHLKQQIKKLLAEGYSDTAISELTSALTMLQEQKPKEKTPTFIVYSDITIEALLHNLTGHNASTALRSSDAGNVLNRFSYQHLSNINKLWDGDSIQIERKKEGSFLIEDARLSLSLMLQPATFEAIFKDKEKIRDTGLLARMLVINSYSTQGTRFYSEHNEHIYLDEFHD